MTKQHYDGDRPDEPLPERHFTREQLEEARQLGDGSPAIDPRRDESATGAGRRPARRRA